MRILLTAILLALAATTFAQQENPVTKKMETLLRRSVTDANISFDKKTKRLVVVERSGAGVFDMQVPLADVNNKFAWKPKNRTDSLFSVNIECKSGHSCIIVTAEKKDHPTKSIMLSFNNGTDARAFSKLMDKLRK